MSEPLKLAFGVYVSVPAVNETLPFVPWVTAVTAKVWLDSLAGPFESLGRGSNVTVPSSATVVVSLTAVGASLTSETVIETVARFESAVPSFARYVKESEPK